VLALRTGPGLSGHTGPSGQGQNDLAKSCPASFSPCPEGPVCPESPGPVSLYFPRAGVSK
jgi:hypothetical protein